MYDLNTPLWERYLMTIEEASSYFRIGENKLRRIASEYKDECVVMNGNRMLIKKKKFEHMIDKLYILSIVMQQVFQKKLCQFPYFLFKEFCRCLKLKNPPWIIIYPGFYIFNVPVLFFVKIFPFWNMAAD